MEAEEFNRIGKELVDYITQYLLTIRERKVFNPDVKPGYMKSLLPDAAPTEPEDWDTIFSDFETIIMPGLTHAQSPHMHSFCPVLNSWPSLLGAMLVDGINMVAFSGAFSPAATELEMQVMDWLCKALGLPSFFLHRHPGSRGGGVLQTSVSESTLVALLAARKDKILQLQAELQEDADDSILNAKLVAYCSDQTHSSFEKAGLISLVKVRILPTDEHFSLRGNTLRRAIEEDKKKGLVPLMLCATLGTTTACSYDSLSELGPVCEEEGLWLHVDAAYAGAAFLCPELRRQLEGVGFSDSFVFNASKWLAVHCDCAAFWVRDKDKLQRALAVSPAYLAHESSEETIEFMNWQVGLRKPFRSLKLWFVLRCFGLKHIQAQIRHGIKMAKLFETYVRGDPRFEIPAEPQLGLVVFTLKEGSVLTRELFSRVNQTGRIQVSRGELHGHFIVRFIVTSWSTTEEDIRQAWDIVSEAASNLLAERLRAEDHVAHQELQLAATRSPVAVSSA